MTGSSGMTWRGAGLRRYPTCLVAEVEVAGSFDEAPSRAFGPLAGYINSATRSPAGSP